MLLVASPAMGGLVLPMVHPCEVGGGEHGHGAATPQGAHSGHAPIAPDDADNGHCTCVGSCHAPALGGVPAAREFSHAFAVGTSVSVQLSPTTASGVASCPLDRLPPTTAPPIG